jgi:hypothetical protein
VGWGLSCCFPRDRPSAHLTSHLAGHTPEGQVDRKAVLTSHLPPVIGVLLGFLGPVDLASRVLIVGDP